MSAKPRPRPRPTAKAIDASSSSSATPTLSSTSKGKAKAQPAVVNISDDDDSSFFNKNQGWAHLKANAQRQKLLDAKKNTPERRYSPSNDDDDDILKSPSKCHRTGPKPKPLPTWTTKFASGKSPILKLRSSVITDSEDEDSRKQRHGGRASDDDDNLSLNSSPRKRKRARRKSSSPTPPPEINEYEQASARLIARRIVEETLGTRGSALEDNVQALSSDDGRDDELDPSVAEVLNRLKKTYKPSPSTDPMLGLTDHGSSGAVEETGGSVAVNVEWIPHPYDESEVGQPRKVWTFTVDRNSSLKEVFRETAQKARIPLNELILLHNDHKIFQSSTAQALAPWVAELRLSGCAENTHQHLEMEKRERRLNPHKPHPVDPNNASNPTSSTANQESTGTREASEAPDGDSKKLRLALRSSSFPGKKILRVRPGMKCAAIVAHYLKVVGVVSPTGSERLTFDGEDLNGDMAIGDVDTGLEEDEWEDEEVLMDVAGV